MNPEERNAMEMRLSAWLDGELERDGAERMSDQVASDEQLARRAARLRQLDGLVRAAVPEAPVSPELLARLGLASPAPAPSAEVVDLAVARRHRAQASAAPAARPWQGRLWRAAAQVLVVGGLGLGAAVWLAPNGASDPAAAPAASYRTLSDRPGRGEPGVPAINAVVTFAAGTDAGTARRIAVAAGATVVGQPTDSGAWKLAVAPARRAAVLAALRQDDRVTMAEPLDGADQ